MAPIVYEARLGVQERRGLAALTDYTRRLIIKEYNLEKFVADSLKDKRTVAKENLKRAKQGVPAEVALMEQLVELANDLLIGTLVANSMSDQFASIVTPHFAYLLDWFPAHKLTVVEWSEPGLVTETESRKRLREEHVPELPGVRFARKMSLPPSTTAMAQYMVVEHGGTPLSQLVIGRAFETGGVRTIDPVDGLFAIPLYRRPFGLRALRSALIQILLAKEAGEELFGLVHHDFFLHNILELDLETAQLRGELQPQYKPYFKNTLVYERSPRHAAERHRYYALTPGEHQNWFAKIIDFGRSYAAIPLPSGGAARCIIFNTSSNALLETGLTVDHFANPMWDMFTLGIGLLKDVRHRFLDATPTEDQPLIDQYAITVCYLAGLPLFARDLENRVQDGQIYGDISSWQTGAARALFTTCRSIMAEHGNRELFFYNDNGELDFQYGGRFSISSIAALALIKAFSRYIFSHERERIGQPSPASPATFLLYFTAIENRWFAPLHGYMSASWCLDNMPFFTTLSSNSAPEEVALTERLPREAGRLIRVGSVPSFEQAFPRASPPTSSQVGGGSPTDSHVDSGDRESDDMILD
jgi:hypothetical protein